jgi:hypothetical protein
MTTLKKIKEYNDKPEQSWTLLTTWPGLFFIFDYSMLYVKVFSLAGFFRPKDLGAVSFWNSPWFWMTSCL